MIDIKRINHKFICEKCSSRAEKGVKFSIEYEALDFDEEPQINTAEYCDVCVIYHIREITELLNK